MSRTRTGPVLRRMNNIVGTIAVLIGTAADQVGIDTRARRRAAQFLTRAPELSWATILGTGMLGAAVGAGLAMLFAPQSGPETRTRLRETASDMWDRALESTADLRTRAGDALARGQKAVADRQTIWSAAFAAGREALDRERTRLGAA